MKSFKAILFATLFFGLTAYSVRRGTPPTADEVVKQACQEAAASHKKVMVIFQASWCGWCHKLDTLLASPECKGLFEQSFVSRHLTIMESNDKKDLENPGAQALYDKYADQHAGIPFFLIIDSAGQVIADSRIKPKGAAPGSSGDNMGYPGSYGEIRYFMQLLQTTSLTSDQLKGYQEKTDEGIGEEKANYYLYGITLSL